MCLTPSPKFGLVRHAAEHASLVFATPFPPVYVVTYDVRNILVCKLKKHYNRQVNVGIFTCDVGFSLVKYTLPDGFFGIQILPNSISAGLCSDPCWGALDAPQTPYAAAEGDIPSPLGHLRRLAHRASVPHHFSKPSVASGRHYTATVAAATCALSFAPPFTHDPRFVIHYHSFPFFPPRKTSPCSFPFLVPKKTILTTPPIL